MKTRKDILQDLIANRTDPSILLAELSQYPWDSEPLVTISSEDLINLLQNYVDGNIRVDNMEAWANAIE